MKKSEIVASINKSFNKASLKVKKYSPEILIVTGVAGIVASTVLACKATTKINDILEKSKKDIDVIHDCVNNEEFKNQYTVEDSKRDLTLVYFQTSIKIVKLYAPSVILGILSLSSIIVSNNILRRRNVALAAAYATIDTSFKEYRSRVVERFGEEVERELKYGIKAKQIEETVIDEESGKKKKIKKKINVVDPNMHSEYARFFDESCSTWEKDSEYNLMFLRAQQQFANDKLKAKGHLFLNEVYDMLDIPRTAAGQQVGWVYNDNNPVGDNYVDFGIYDLYKEKNRDFVNGYERSILLDFNVDGNILHLI